MKRKTHWYAHPPTKDVEVDGDDCHEHDIPLQGVYFVHCHEHKGYHQHLMQQVDGLDWEILD